jgi:hypothetical protein
LAGLGRDYKPAGQISAAVQNAATSRSGAIEIRARFAGREQPHHAVKKVELLVVMRVTSMRRRPPLRQRQQACLQEASGRAIAQDHSRATLSTMEERSETTRPEFVEHNDHFRDSPYA